MGLVGQILGAIVSLLLALAINFALSLDWTSASSLPSSPSPFLLLILLLFLALPLAAASSFSSGTPIGGTAAMSAPSLRHIFDASGSVLEQGDAALHQADELEGAAEAAKKDGNLCFAADDFQEAACHYARGLAILGMKGDGGAGGGERQGAKTQGEGMGATSAGVSEGLACGVRVAVAVEGGGLEKEGMIAYDNEDGTYDIVTDDNQDLDGIMGHLIRILPSENDALDLALEASLALNAAKCAFKLGDLVLAEGLASRAIDKEPGRASSYFVRGRVRLAMPHLDDAKDDLKKAVQGEPGNNEYIRVYNDCVGRVKERNASNKQLAQMFLGHMKAEGVGIGGIMPPPQ